METTLPLLIREEQPHDKDQVRKVNLAAFDHPGEADLVDNLRAEGVTLLSLVARLEGHIVGHILFTRMTIETDRGPLDAAALAPMAVLPDYQGRQIGSSLIRQGLANLRERGERIVIVLGHKEYYPRFGFSPAKARNLISPFPRDAYMALELTEGALTGVHGTVRYPAAFGV